MIQAWVITYDTSAFVSLGWAHWKVCCCLSCWKSTHGCLLEKHSWSLPPACTSRDFPLSQEGFWYSSEIPPEDSRSCRGEVSLWRSSMGILYSEVHHLSESRVPKMLKVAHAFQMQFSIPVNIFLFCMFNSLGGGIKSEKIKSYVLFFLIFFIV